MAGKAGAPQLTQRIGSASLNLPQTDIEKDQVARRFAERVAAFCWDSSPCEACKERLFDSDIRKKRSGVSAGTTLCGRCRSESSKLNADRPIYKFSRDNGMDPGDEVPDELKRLTYLESLLIARIIPQIRVFRLVGGNLGYSGHCISLRNDVKQVAQKLPRAPHDAGIVMVTKFARNGQDFHRFNVRRQCVLDALRFLTSPQPDCTNRPPGLSSEDGRHLYNPAYADVEIDMDVCNSLPEDGVPEFFLTKNNEAHDRQSCEAVHNAGPLDDDGTDPEVVHLGVQDINSEILSRRPVADVIADRVLQSEPYVHIVNYEDVVNEYTHSSTSTFVCFCFCQEKSSGGN
eukprot:ANDGO_02186.mRNA.1 hypothetical protein EMIHUDRAFT_458224